MQTDLYHLFQSCQPFIWFDLGHSNAASMDISAGAYSKTPSFHTSGAVCSTLMVVFLPRFSLARAVCQGALLPRPRPPRERCPRPPTPLPLVLFPLWLVIASTSGAPAPVTVAATAGDWIDLKTSSANLRVVSNSGPARLLPAICVLTTCGSCRRQMPATALTAQHPAGRGG